MGNKNIILLIFCDHFEASEAEVIPFSSSFWFVLEEQNTPLILILFMPFDMLLTKNAILYLA